MLELDDDAEFNILPHIPEAVDFIEQGRRQGTVFVHCMQGQSRSVVIVAAYFMVVYNLSSRAAINLLKRRHKASQPIASFLEQLKSLEDPNQPERILAAQAARRVSQGAAPLPLSNMASASTHRRHTSSDGGSGGVGGKEGQGVALSVFFLLCGCGLLTLSAAHNTTQMHTALTQ